MSFSNSKKSAKSSSSPMVSKFLQQQLQRYMQDLPKFIKSDAFYKRSSLQESPGASIIVDPVNSSVSLTCPISLQRQVVPVRTLLCQHVETFDLENFISAIPSVKLPLLKLGSRPSSQNHTCPVCKLEAPLYIDLKIQRALQDFPNNVLKAMVDPGLGELRMPREEGLDTSYIDLVTPDLITPSLSLTSAPPSTTATSIPSSPFELSPTALEFPKQRNSAGGQRRRFSFGDNALLTWGSEFQAFRERYRRLSTVDLSSPA